MRLFFLFISLFILSCSNLKMDKTSTITEEEKAIAKNLIQGAFDDLWAGVDSTKILNYHTDDFILLEHGEVWDNNRIKEYMRGQLENDGRANRVNSFDFFLIEKYGHSIQLAYNNKAEFYRNDSLAYEGTWLESALAIKTSDGWKLKMMHSTRN